MVAPIHNDAAAGGGASPSPGSGGGDDPYATLGEAIPGLVWFCDPQGICNYASPRCREYTGADFLHPQGNGGLNFAHPEDDSRFRPGWTEAFKAGRPHDAELRLRRHDGVYRWHRAYSVPERDEQKSVKRWVVVCVDIDEAKRAQQESVNMREQLKQANEGLERTVAARTRQLQEVIEQLEAFAYSIAHDMRAPLRTIHQYAEMVARDFAPKIPQQAHQYLHKIMGAAEKLDAFIREVLVYTRVSQGDMNIRPTDLDSLMEGLLLMSPELGPPKVDLNLRSPLGNVVGDETALLQVFSNLLSNAVKFMPADKKPKIEIWTEPKGENIRIFIKDNGIGMPREDCERIFKMFERLQPESKYEGSGIGLTIVRRAVERMGGTIHVESTVGQGSTFWFDLKKGEAC
jgi:PAS domain S-box-containing protein